MKSDLDQIIEYFEGEKIALTSSINNYLLEKDYLYAHYQQEELWRIDRQLSHLHYLKDPLYFKKQELERLRDMFNKFPEDDRVRFSFGRRITEKEGEIKISESKRYYFNDTQVLDDALFNLYEGKFKKFKLCLNKPSDLYMYFELSAGNMLNIFMSSQEIMEMYGYDKENYDDEDNERELFILKKMGFEKVGESEWIVYFFDMNDFQDATAVKILLSRIAYEVFGLLQGSEYLQASLEYIS